MAHFVAVAQIHANPLIFRAYIKTLIIGCLVCFLALPNASHAQKASSKAEKRYNEAIQYINANNYGEAEKLLRKLVKKQPNYARAWVTLADLQIQLNQPSEAEKSYRQAIQAKSDFSYRPFFQLGRLQMARADYAAAKPNFESVLKFRGLPGNTMQDASLYLNQCQFAIEALANPVPYVAMNWGDSINSELDEYLPALTADDQTLIYTRKNGPTGEDFFISSKNADGSWKKASLLPPPLNSDGNEGAHCLSADGRTIYFTACYREDSKGGCDIYVSKLTSEGWSTPQNLGLAINTSHWETQPSISFDGKTLYFVSNRPGGFGGSDIWMSRKNELGEWSKPENMGPYINSRKDEISPFIHYDDQTLYFASEGMAGMGRLDLYLSKRQPDGEFGPARNLGYPINTEKDESSLFVNMAGNLAMFSSESGDSRGKNDIFYFEIPEEIRPERAIYVKGRLVDAESRRPLAGKVEIVDLSTGAVVFSEITFPSDGRFLTSLPAGKAFAFNASRGGYLFYSENFTIDPKRSSDVYEIALQPIKAGNEVILRNIFYQSNAATLQEQSLVELRKLQEFLAINPNMIIEIQGHTDNIGGKTLNTELSTQRAKNVYDALIRFGVNAKQLTYKGYGDSKPIAGNDTEAGRSTNRRTQFKVMQVN